jgi:uncharacterized membrane protein (DUF485 family)
MLKDVFKNIQEKSLKERFLLVIGILFFVIYLILGLTVIFWENFPIQMKPSYRVAFGIILIAYSFLRFIRFFNSNKE